MISDQSWSVTISHWPLCLCVVYLTPCDKHARGAGHPGQTLHGGSSTGETKGSDAA